MSGAISIGTLATVAGIGAAGSVGGALISSNAAGKAASTQSDAAKYAADLQSQASDKALAFQKQQWDQTQANEAPWLRAGASGLNQLQYLLGIGNSGQYNSGGAQGGYGGIPTQGSPISAPGSGIAVRGGPVQGVRSNVMMGNNADVAAGGMQPLTTMTGGGTAATGATGPTASPVNTSLGAFGSLMTPYSGTFKAPDAITEQNDPGYQARLKLGTDALQRSAAARGGVLTGGAAKDLTNYAQDYASNEYGNVYNRALTDYTTKYNAYNNDQANQYNRLAALSGVGQTTANQMAVNGQNASNNVSNNLLSTAQNMGQQYNNAAAATASGYVGSANAWGGALGNTTNSLSNLYLLNKLYGG